ncbi:TPA: NucA/NucB deoxyribonuclease domain-containing protein [Streptococcus suis]
MGLGWLNVKGAGLGAITGFVGGQFIGAGANVAANVTQNITNQTVRHVVSAGVEAGVETAIDTGISLATGNPISLKNVATDYGLNLITNGTGSISNTSATKPIKDVTPVNNQKLLTGPDPNALRLEAPKQKLALPMPNDIVTIQVSKRKYPQSAQHIQDARASGQPSILTINRTSAKTNRSQSLKGIDKVPGKDLDEYPPAMFSEGGAGASVRAIEQSDNRGSGSSMGHQLRPFDNGTKVYIDIVD